MYLDVKNSESSELISRHFLVCPYLFICFYTILSIQKKCDVSIEVKGKDLILFMYL